MKDHIQFLAVMAVIIIGIACIFLTYPYPIPEPIHALPYDSPFHSAPSTNATLTFRDDIDEGFSYDIGPRTNTSPRIRNMYLHMNSFPFWLYVDGHKYQINHGSNGCWMEEKE